jgi:oligopeptide/dipeptide ABC transporter ATP-binding protein
VPAAPVLEVRDLRVRGCRFRGRCPLAIDECGRVTPRRLELAPGHEAACHVAARAAVGP